MNKIYTNIKNFLTSLNKHHISEYTAQCAYYTILSFIPFLIFIVTLVQYTGISKESLLEIIQNIVPETMADSVFGVLQEVYSKSVGTISISAIFVIWSARKGFYALSKGLHKIYETDKEYNFLHIQIKSFITTILLACVIILVLLISVFGNPILEFIQLKFKISEQIENIFHISKVGIYLLLFIVVLLMYRFIPGHKQGIKKQIPGAIIATLGWYVISLFFSIYIDTFKGFSVMYGSLTTIVLAMMWVYFCMYIILIGAEVNNFNKGENKDYSKEYNKYKLNYIEKK